MELIDGIMHLVERWGVQGLMAGIIVVLAMTVRRLDERNQTLTDKHLEDKARQIEGMAAHKTVLDQILFILERLSDRADR